MSDHPFFLFIMFLTYEMAIKSRLTIKEFDVFSLGITFYIKIESKNQKNNWLEQILMDGQDGLN